MRARGQIRSTEQRCLENVYNSVRYESVQDFTSVVGLTGVRTAIEGVRVSVQSYGVISVIPSLRAKQPNTGSIE